MFSYLEGVFEDPYVMTGSPGARQGFLIEFPWDPKPGPISVHVYVAYSEKARTLYGFSSAADRQLFEVLLGVSGMGPKTAMNVMRKNSSADLLAALSSSDQKVLSSLVGVSKAMSAKLSAVKLPPSLLSDASEVISDDVADAISAATHLGVPADVARKVALANRSVPAAELVTLIVRTHSHASGTVAS